MTAATIDTSRNVLIFDTETTGFVHGHLPDDHADQPHIVQLAAALVQPDGRVLGSINFIVNPGVPIPDAAAKVHGISTAMAQAYGVKPVTALGALCLLATHAGGLVAHNIKFDAAILAIAVARGLAPDAILKLPRYCTMERATPIVNLPPTDRMIAAGRRGPKAPQLGECVKHFFNETLDGAHDAMVDVMGCRRVYLHLRSLPKAA